MSHKFCIRLLDYAQRSTQSIWPSLTIMQEGSKITIGLGCKESSGCCIMSTKTSREVNKFDLKSFIEADDVEWTLKQFGCLRCVPQENLFHLGLWLDAASVDYSNYLMIERYYPIVCVKLGNSLGACGICGGREDPAGNYAEDLINCLSPDCLALTNSYMAGVITWWAVSAMSSVEETEGPVLLQDIARVIKMIAVELCIRAGRKAVGV